ncbi:MAG: SDR family oxidoreductase [Acidobacteriaceae bacterium]|nr:SDR family oxidoreductase [Acidobacteriaceae bacterium]
MHQVLFFIPVGRLKNKIAFITGASRGIGAGLARKFAAEGASLMLTARDGQALERLSGELESSGSEAAFLPGDVTSEPHVVAAFDLLRQRFGRLDLLVNNAGAFDGGPFEDLTLQAWEHVMAVNLRGPFLCAREAFRIMKEQGGGRIINVGSISAQRVRPRSAPYSTSKHGIWGLTQSIALDGRQYGISCSCIHPGNTQVERRSDNEPMMSVEELAETIVTMAALPAHVNMLEAIVLPVDQLYVGRG